MTSGRSAKVASSRLSIEEAVAALVAAVEVLDEETIAVDDACGRTTARPVAAAASVPDVHLAAMDGIAVRASDLAGAHENAPVELSSDGAPGAGGFAWIDTGQALPPGADAVVMVERVEPVSEAGGGQDGTEPESGREGVVRARRVRVREAPAPWMNVRVVGEDVVVGERLLPAGHRIAPAGLGLLLAAGVHRVAVRRAPVVAILPTGDELVEPGAERPPGTTIESNSRVLAEMLRARGAEPLRLPRVRDDAEALARAVADAAARADVVCTIAGSSAGSRDWTSTAFAAVGSLFAPGIGLVPGRPTILAALEPSPARRARVAIGLPGYPIAAAMVAREIRAPLVARLLGEPRVRPATREAVAAEAIPSRSDLEELVRVEVARVGGRALVHPLARGAGALSSLARAAGLVRLRPGAGGVARGDVVAVEDLSAGATPFTLLLAGLGDPAIDAFE
ncbi:MAG: molybdopterin-binding protein, partial [Alphaproteobacteria bacterium]